jgi:hypothetical protein
MIEGMIEISLDEVGKISILKVAWGIRLPHAAGATRPSSDAAGSCRRYGDGASRVIFP